MDAGDAAVRAGEELGREVAQGADHLRLDQLDLPMQVGLAGVDLVRLGVAVAGRPGFEDVRHEHVLRATARSRPAAGRAAARPGPRRAAPGGPRGGPGASPTNIRSASALPFPKTTLVRPCVQRAARAAGSLPVERDEVLAPLGCGTGLHRPKPRRAQRRRPGTAETADAVSLSAPAATRPPEWTGRRMNSEQQRITDARGRPRPRGRRRSAAALGTALAAALREAGVAVEGPARPRRGAGPSRRDRAVRARRGDRGGRGGGGRGRAAGRPHERRHPARGAPSRRAAETLRAAPASDLRARRPGRETLPGRGCAVAGSTPRALDFAAALAGRLGMTPFEIDDEGRAAYHAAASVASNFLVTLQAAAESIAAGAGLEPGEARALLVPLLRRTVENWRELGPERALTGPIARGDHATVGAQRAAVEEVAPAPARPLRRARARTRSRSPAGGAGVRTVGPWPGCARRSPPSAAPGASIGLVPTMGVVPRGPPLARAPGARARATWWWSRCS